MSWSKKVLNSIFEIFGHGGGKIKRKSNILVLMLLVLTLPLSANIAFATTNTSDQNSGQSDQIYGQNLDINTTQSSKQETTQETVPSETKNMEAKTTSNITNQAAGSASSTTKVTTEKTFTSNQINEAANRVKAYIEKYHKLPNYVAISSVQVSMPQFLQLLTTNILNINKGLHTSITLKLVTSPSKPSESVKTGKLYKKVYLSLAQTIKTSISKNGIAPAYINSALGKIRYESLIYNFSKILAYYKTSSRLPNYVTVSSWKSTSSSSEGSPSTITSSALKKYLAATTNAQSTSSTIVSLANSITSGCATTYAKAVAIFNYVRSQLSYSYYYNSKKGALGALSSKKANCCDTAHLVVALSRAAGIPARYQHGYCKFSDGWYGHVWAQMYVNGKWYYADAISDSNTFGAINNWNLKTYKLYGTYASLPF